MARRNTKSLRGFISDVGLYVYDSTAAMINNLLWRTTDQEPDWYFRNDPPAEVLPHLLVGNFYHAGSAESIRRNDIRHIVSVGYRSIANPLRTISLKTRVECEVGDDVTELLLPHFAKLTEQIRANIEAGETTYVHCHRGRSRSVTVVAAYLIRYEKMTATAAVTHIKRRRPMACPNAGFQRQLVQWERLWTPPTTS